MRELFGWGPPAPLFRAKNYTHVPKVKTRDERRHKPLPADAVLAVFDRDEYTCRKCGFLGYAGYAGYGRVKLEIDHIIPESCGGTHDIFNLTTLCRRCNTRRGAYYPAPAILV